jgi:hypothetical protein
MLAALLNKSGEITHPGLDQRVGDAGYQFVFSNVSIGIT